MSRLSLKKTTEKVINNSFLQNLFLIFLFLLFNIILIFNFLDKHKIYVYNLNITINNKDLSIYSDPIFEGHLKPEILKILNRFSDISHIMGKKRFKNIIVYNFMRDNYLDFYIRANTEIDLKIFYDYLTEEHNTVLSKFIASYTIVEFANDILNKATTFNYNEHDIFDIYWESINEIRNHNFLEIFYIKKINYKFIINYLFLIILNSLYFIFFEKN